MFQQLRQRAAEWHQPLSVAAVDFIRHSTQWSTAAHGRLCRKALRSHTYRCPHNSTTNKEQQHTPTSKAKPFHIKQGTKQGDPLSTLLFNSSLQPIMKPLKNCTETSTVSDLPNTTVTRTFPTSSSQTTFFSTAERLSQTHDHHS